MELKLKRPLAFFDLETTGVNIATDRIVEISILKVNIDNTEEVYTRRVNPLMPIPVESSMFHGIYDEHIKDAPTFKDLAKEIADFIGDSDLAGYNSNKFDVPMLMEGRSFVDVQNIFHQMEQRTLKAAYKFYCGKSLDNAHQAEDDVRATYEVLKAQLTKYENESYTDKHGQVSYPVVNEVEALHQFTNLTKPVDFAGRFVYDEQGEVCINFGKHKGRRLRDVFESEPSYYSWMQNGDFPLYTKRILEKQWNAYKNEKNTQKAPADKTVVSKPKVEEKAAKPITNDMLASLQNKFSK